MAQSLAALKPAEATDAPILSSMAADAFLNDRQTNMKSFGRKPYNLAELGHDDNLEKLTRPTCTIIKAVDNATGKTIGFCSWSYRCFSEEEIVDAAGSRNIDLEFQERVKQEAKLALAERERVATEAREKGNLGEISWEDYTTAELNKDDPIVRLEKLTDADMARWQAILEPPNTKCLVLTGCSVDPAFQGRGVGSALLATMTRIADRAGVHVWLHSSEAGWKAYQKAGFDVVGILDVDLDEYAPVPAPDKDGKWGHYIFRYMKRMPIKKQS